MSQKINNFQFRNLNNYLKQFHCKLGMIHHMLYNLLLQNHNNAMDNNKLVNFLLLESSLHKLNNLCLNFDKYNIYYCIINMYSEKNQINIFQQDKSCINYLQLLDMLNMYHYKVNNLQNQFYQNNLELDNHNQAKLIY